MDSYTSYVAYCERMGIKPMAEPLWSMEYGYTTKSGSGWSRPDKAGFRKQAKAERKAMRRDLDADAAARRAAYEAAHGPVPEAVAEQ